jgi:prevent-host-death family protein
MKKKASLPLYKQRTPALKMRAESSGPLLLRETVSMPGVGLTIPVRAAKAKFSALLELVASGQEVTITSDGRPKAKLVKAEPDEPGKVFQGMGDYLMKQPIHGGPTADEIIREDRDSRGW